MSCPPGKLELIFVFLFMFPSFLRLHLFLLFVWHHAKLRVVGGNSYYCLLLLLKTLVKDVGETRTVATACCCNFFQIRYFLRFFFLLIAWTWRSWLILTYYRRHQYSTHEIIIIMEACVPELLFFRYPFFPVSTKYMLKLQTTCCMYVCMCTPEKYYIFDDVVCLLLRDKKRLFWDKKTFFFL